MNDKDKVNVLAKSIQYAHVFIYKQSKDLYENYNDYDIDFNIQVLINFFYSIIETTDGIYSLTYDKNVGSINALSRIQYESVIQFLAMIEGDFRENILSYEYHQIKDLVQKNEYLISVNKKFSESHFKVEQQKWKRVLQDNRFQKVKKKIPKQERYTKWFIVTKGKPRSINQLINNYFQSTGILDKQAVKMYYSLLSGNIHNHNVNRFIEDNVMLPIRRDNLKDTSIDLATTFMFASLLRFADFLETELMIKTDNREEIEYLFENCLNGLKS